MSDRQKVAVLKYQGPLPAKMPELPIRQQPLVYVVLPFVKTCWDTNPNFVKFMDAKKGDTQTGKVDWDFYEATKLVVAQAQAEKMGHLLEARKMTKLKNAVMLAIGKCRIALANEAAKTTGNEVAE
jgi:hypothetical protein